MLACGHEPSPHTESTTGTGWIDGVEICNECCDLHARIQLKRSHGKKERFTCYMSENGVTTWTGGLLGSIIRAKKVKLTRRSYTHGTYIVSYRVRDVHGNEWIGRGNPGIVTTMRPVG